MLEEEGQDRGGFRQDDSGAGDALAMGMDVDIPAATTAGDRREAERRRGREGRYTCSTTACHSVKCKTGVQTHDLQLH